MEERLTPHERRRRAQIERLRSKGLEVTDDGTISTPHGAEVPVVEMGHDSGRNAQHAELVMEFHLDAWAYFDARDPLLELRCETTRKSVARFWQDPDANLWWRDHIHQVPVRDWVTDAGNIGVQCPEHGLTLVPLAWVNSEAASTRRTATIHCTDPRPVYYVTS